MLENRRLNRRSTFGNIGNGRMSSLVFEDETCRSDAVMRKKKVEIEKAATDDMNCELKKSEASESPDRLT